MRGIHRSLVDSPHKGLVMQKVFSWDDVIMATVPPPSSASYRRGQLSGLEYVHHPHHVLPADGALMKPPATGCTSDHVTTLQQHTVNHSIHADFADFWFTGASRTIWKEQYHMIRWNNTTLLTLRRIVALSLSKTKVLLDAEKPLGCLDQFTATI